MVKKVFLQLKVHEKIPSPTPPAEPTGKEHMETTARKCCVFANSISLGVASGCGWQPNNSSRWNELFLSSYSLFPALQVGRHKQSQDCSADSSNNLIYCMINLFYALKLLCFDSPQPHLFQSGDCQNETRGWEIMLSRFVIPRCGSSPSYVSGFLRSLVAALRGKGHFRTGKYCLKKLCWKQASPDAKKKPAQPPPPRPSPFL